MALLKRQNIPAATLPEEAVQVDELGGEVAVRGLRLSDRLTLIADEKSENSFVTRLLALTVLDADAKPVYSVEGWEAFGSRHSESTMRLFTAARRLSGLDAEVNEKK